MTVHLTTDETIANLRQQITDLQRTVTETAAQRDAALAGVAQASPLPWPSREVVAREIRRAMLDNPTTGGFKERAEKREAIANDAADAILARFAASQPPAAPVETDGRTATLIKELREQAIYVTNDTPPDEKIKLFISYLERLCKRAADEIERLSATRSSAETGEAK